MMKSRKQSPIVKKRDSAQSSIPLVASSSSTSVPSSVSTPSHGQPTTARGQTPAVSSAMQLKLISVDFKEAALDSPSFRATINHLDAQVDNIEKWLLALISTIRKFPNYVKELKVFSDSFLEHLLPTFLQDGLIEQEYTVLALQTVSKGMHKLWDAALTALTLDSGILDGLKSVVEIDIKAYKRLRKKFEVIQSKYDRYLAIYQSTPKNKDPSIVMEDAYQLFEVRKEYIHVSIELSIELTTLGHTLDKVFVRLTSDIWGKNSNVFEKFNTFASFYSESTTQVRRIQNWCDSNDVALDKLSSDMATARIQVENSTNLQHQPSTNINDYRTALINNTNIQEIDEPSTEKHGYLFMKSWRNVKSRKSNGANEGDGGAAYEDNNNNPNLSINSVGNNGGNGGSNVNTNGNHKETVEKRQIWVKRWAFVKGGVFGLLNLSPSNTFVQESDKIGLLICNVKYAPYEDRRNCFEVKTIDSTFIFQCETIFELKSWLKVFQNEKSRILEESDNSNLFNIASGRYPPILKELSCTINTVSDRMITSSRIVNGAGQVIAPSKLSTHIEANEKDFKKHVYYQLLHIRPPFSTDSTKSAILAHSLVEATNIPTAITANICGSINWGLYYLHDYSSFLKLRSPETSYEVATESSTPSELAYESDDIQGYPTNYQHSMYPNDMQMRALFETGVGREEYCLLSFRVMWSPNSRQELGGRCFVTADHVYSYMNALGFIAYYKGRIDQLVSIEYSKQPDYDLLRLYNLNGVVKMKLFLGDAALICKKLDYLIKNKVSEKPDSIEQIMQKMQTFDNESANENTQTQSANSNINRNLPLLSGPQEPFPSVNTQNSLSEADMATTSFNNIPANQVQSKAYRIDFTDESTLLATSSYNIPPRAIFHALLGDNSAIFNQMYSYTKLKKVIRKPWNTDPTTGKLFRKINTMAIFETSQHEVQIEQRIDNMEDDNYFNFTHSKAKFKFPFTGAFKIAYRIVIYAEGRDKSRVLVYGTPVFEKESVLISTFIKKNGVRVCKQEAQSLLASLKEAEKTIGTHGMTVKAIYIFGKLSKAIYKDDTPDVPATKFGFLTILYLLIYRVAVYSLGYTSQFFHILANGIISLIRAIRMNQLILLFLTISSLFNVFLVGRSTISFWTARKVSQMADSYLSSDTWTIQRAVYVKDTEDMLKRSISVSHANESEPSRVYDSFRKISFCLNHGRMSSWDSEYGDSQTRETAKNLKRSIQEIAVKRNELLVHLNMLNQMEEEIAKGEWQNWLLNEIHRCEFIQNEILSMTSNLEELESGTESIIDYCNSCSIELKHLELI
ncbi:membrane-anchored lipid-binding protein Sip3p [[Candida] railenensis]|uniref:Membrane-anchored lipid-binding protein Sip3p n=1 Tax=[Candida] railenensis TaxID=45579 RepID=A0A9P0QM47_9ASCO|nr:membrane-anchored lipid-binding protein Sip3p [[Candida] railenensis]